MVGILTPSTKNYYLVNDVGVSNGIAWSEKSITLPVNSNLQNWADTLPAAGVYDIYVTVPQGNLPASWWYIELLRHSNDSATGLYHTMRATSLSGVANQVYINTCILGVWSGWIEQGVNNALTWITPTFVNSWADYASGYSAKYAQDSMGVVYMKGLVKSGSDTTATIIFTLPAGMRPLSATRFSESISGGEGSLEVNIIGNVQFVGSELHTGNANTWLSIQATFKGEQ